MSKGLVVIGGGAAGMMAAVSAAERGAQVTLLEPNERLGKKLNITGKGRCNVTNNADVQTLLANVPRNGKFLYSAFSRFDGRDTMAFFASIGVPLKTERGNRVFPVSDRAFDVSAALERRLKALKVSLVRDRATELEITSGAVTGVRGERGTYPAGAVVLATGGVSYPATGSTGEGHRMAREAGHTVTDLQGSLVPLRDYGLGRELQGLSLRNVGLAVFEDRKKIYTDFGEMLFTHFGLSGPMILSASAHLRHMARGRYTVHIDLKPALTPEQLDSRLVRDLRAEQNRAFGTLLGGLLPRSMVPVMAELCGVPPERKCHSVTREERAGLLRLLKDLPVRIAGFRPVEEAIVTAGGVALKEIDAKTMASKKLPGLFFAGEVLDLDAYTGGFNLQIAFATGQAAGRAV